MMKGMFSALTSLVLRRTRANGFMGATHEGKRDFYNIFGWKEELQPEDYHWKFRRQGIASRIAVAYPDETWDHPPRIVEDKDDTSETDWEKSVRVYFKRHQLWSYLWRADVLANLNRYSILFLGIQDGKGHDQEYTGGKAELKFIRVYGEDCAEVEEWETDATNPRYAMPKVYKVKVQKVLTRQPSQSMQYEEILVHHSRVLHIAETLLDNEIYGVPRMEQCFNDLDDLIKVSGGASEIFWANARGGLQLNIDPDAQLGAEDKAKLQEEVEDYMHQIARFIRTQGVEVKPIEMEVATPLDHFTILTDLLAATTGIPKRILFGSERGQLASEQDDKNWRRRVEARRNKFSEPRIIYPLLEKLMVLGEIEPKEFGDWDIEWEDVSESTEAQKAEITIKKANAILAYAQSPGSEFVVPPRQFVEDILGLPFQGEADINKILQAEAGIFPGGPVLPGSETPKPAAASEE